MVYNSIDGLRRAVIKGELKPTKDINVKRLNELDKRRDSISYLQDQADAREAEFKARDDEELVTTSAMVHPEGNKRD